MLTIKNYIEGNENQMIQISSKAFAQDVTSKTLYQGMLYDIPEQYHNIEVEHSAWLLSAQMHSLIVTDVNVYKTLMDYGTEKMTAAAKLPTVKCDNPSRTIVFDTETTGFYFDVDEVLQLSIIDGDGNTLFDSYVKPYWTMEWPDAQRVNGITKDMLKDAPYPHEIIPVVRGIFESAEKVIAYNADYDFGMLRKWGVEQPEDTAIVDVMLDFAEVYGVWDDYRGCYKWQKLTHCAAYYDYLDYKAHSSLEDCKATLHCYKAMSEQKEKEIKKAKHDISL